MACHMTANTCEDNVSFFLLMSNLRSSSDSSCDAFDSNTPGMRRVWGKGNPDYDGTLSIVVVGASGNLAMLKVWVAQWE